MTARPARPDTSTNLVADHGAAPDAVTADPDLALARWENEGGVPARPRRRDGVPVPPH